MLVNCGGPEVSDLPLTPSQKEAAISQARQLTLDAILAGLDVWTAVKGRIRDSVHAQVLTRDGSGAAGPDGRACLGR